MKVVTKTSLVLSIITQGIIQDFLLGGTMRQRPPIPPPPQGKVTLETSEIAFQAYCFNRKLVLICG